MNFSFHGGPQNFKNLALDIVIMLTGTLSAGMSLSGAAMIFKNSHQIKVNQAKSMDLKPTFTLSIH
jgi:hypothetical protein